MAADGPRPRLPVLLLTGALGSGKTTLLRDWLAQPELAGAAVVLNEAGAVALDAGHAGALRDAASRARRPAFAARACPACQKHWSSCSGTACTAGWRASTAS